MAGRKMQGNAARKAYFKAYASEDRGQKNAAIKYAARVRKMERLDQEVKFKTLEEQQAHCRKVCAKAKSNNNKAA